MKMYLDVNIHESKILFVLWIVISLLCMVPGILALSSHDPPTRPTPIGGAQPRGPQGLVGVCSELRRPPERSAGAEEIETIPAATSSQSRILAFKAT